MIKNLKSQLEPVLKEASTLYIATALITEAGYNFIESNIPKDCNKNYLVGIDLAINPKILQKLLEKSNTENTNARICKPKYTFHPKVYLIEKTDGKFVGFIGSANTTEGGLSNNIEISTQIDSQEQCCEILNWFKELYKSSIDLSPELIDKYSKIYIAAKQRQAIHKADLEEFRKDLPVVGNLITSLKHQYFKQDDFDAFSLIYQWDRSVMARQQRKLVKLKFIELHNSIYHKFRKYGLNNLSCHSRKGNIVSSHAHTARSRPCLDAMWLHYGSKDGKLPDHPRLQVILRGNTIGIWLMIGKNKGSKQEREKLRSNLQDEFFTELLYKNIKNLGGIYWIDVNHNPVFTSIASIQNAADLKRILLTDNKNCYFTIGRNYDNTASELSEENFQETLLLEFQRLNEVYKTMLFEIS